MKLAILNQAARLILSDPERAGGMLQVKEFRVNRLGLHHQRRERPIPYGL